MSVQTLNQDKNWIQTYKGGAFWPLSPKVDDLDIEDIAHALGMLCRYTGHVRWFYSVAEHSVLVSKAVDPQYALWGLLHDASEAYLTDLPRPIKPLLPQYKEAENRLMACVCERYGLDLQEPAQVKEMDTRILHNERSFLLHTSVRDWELSGEPIPNIEIKCWSPREAEIAFLQRFNELYIMDPKITTR